MTFNPATGTLSGTPASGTGGSYPITFTATNAAGSTPQSFTLVVSQPAVITSHSTVSFKAGKANTFTVTATGFPAPTFTETGALPSGLTFDGTTGILSGNPVAVGNGASNYSITFTAVSAGGNGTQSFHLVVTP